MNYIVYVHIFPNNKRYVGITQQKAERRWQNGNGYKTQQLMYRAIEKYKWHNIEHKILYTGLSKEEAEQKEIELIKEWKTNNSRYGYNSSIGGEVISLGCVSSKTKRKQISKKVKELWKSEKYLNHMRIAHKKPIICVETGIEYISAMDIQRKLNINNSSVTACCNGKRQTAGGYHWKHKDII